MHTCTSLCTHTCVLHSAHAHVYFSLHTCVHFTAHFLSLDLSVSFLIVHMHTRTCVLHSAHTRVVHYTPHTHGVGGRECPSNSQDSLSSFQGSPGFSGWALNREGLHPKLSALCLSPGGSPGLRAILPVKDSKAGGCSLARGRRHTRQGPARRDGRTGGQHCPEQRRGTNHTSHGGTHRSAVVVPENLLVEVVKELLLQLEHHLLGVGRQSRGPLPRAGPRGWGASEQGGSRGAIRAGGPLLRAGPRGEGQSRGPSPGRDHGGGGVRAGGGLGEPSEQGALPRAGHCVQRGVRAGGPPFQGGAPPQGGATGGRVRAGAPPQGACAPSALTFRSLSDSRNISFTTSLVSAARTVCIVAFVQRVWERHGGTRSETCHLAARPGPSILAVRLGAHSP